MASQLDLHVIVATNRCRKTFARKHEMQTSTSHMEVSRHTRCLARAVRTWLDLACRRLQMIDTEQQSSEGSCWSALSARWAWAAQAACCGHVLSLFRPSELYGKQVCGTYCQWACSWWQPDTAGCIPHVLWHRAQQLPSCSGVSLHSLPALQSRAGRSGTPASPLHLCAQR